MDYFHNTNAFLNVQIKGNNFCVNAYIIADWFHFMLKRIKFFDPEQRS